MRVQYFRLLFTNAKTMGRPKTHSQKEQKQRGQLNDATYRLPHFQFQEVDT